MGDNDIPQDRPPIPTSASMVEEGGYRSGGSREHSKASSICTLLPVMMTTLGAPSSDFMTKNAEYLIGKD